MMKNICLLCVIFTCLFTFRKVKERGRGTDNANLIIRIEDTAFIPSDPGNKDWAQYQVCVSSGYVPDPSE